MINTMFCFWRWCLKQGVVNKGYTIVKEDKKGWKKIVGWTETLTPLDCAQLDRRGHRWFRFEGFLMLSVLSLLSSLFSVSSIPFFFLLQLFCLFFHFRHSPFCAPVICWIALSVFMRPFLSHLFNFNLFKKSRLLDR